MTHNLPTLNPAKQHRPWLESDEGVWLIDNVICPLAAVAIIIAPTAVISWLVL